MKLKTIVAAALSFAAAFATAQSLNFNGVNTSNDTFEGIWLSASPNVATGNQINTGNLSTYKSVLPDISLALGQFRNKLIDNVTATGFDYTYLLVKVDNNAPASGADFARFTAKLDLPVGYVFLNNTQTLTTGGADANFWRGLSILDTDNNDPNYALQNSTFQSLLTTPGLTNLDDNGSGLWATALPTSTNQDTIFATVIKKVTPN